MIDELRALQVFYVNIGGGEPMIRRDFFELVDYSRRQRRSASSSRPTAAFIDADKARRLAATDYLDVQISLDGTDAVHQRRRPRRRLVRHRPAGDGSPRRAPASARSRSRSSSPATTSTSSTTSSSSPTRTARSCASPACDRRGAAPTRWHELHPTNDQQRQIYRWLLAHGERRAHRRLVLPPQRPRRAAARPQPVRRRAGRVPDRPGRRRLRLPVRDPRRVQGRQRPRPGRLRPGVARQRAVPLAARAAVGRSLRLVRVVRRLPGRLHGRQVLHRPAARRTRPRVRRRRRRAGAGRRRRRVGAAIDGRPLEAGRVRHRSRSSVGDRHVGRC